MLAPRPAVAMALGSGWRPGVAPVAVGWAGCGLGGSTENRGLCRGGVITTPTTPSELSSAYGRT